MKIYGNFKDAIKYAEGRMLDTSYPIQTEKWQGIKLENPMRETLNVSFQCVMPEHISDMVQDIKPNLPWADDHFMERVGGEPSNPGKTYMNWPFYKKDAEMRKEKGQFSHSYMERIWPKNAGDGSHRGGKNMVQMGIRYEYGDFQDIINLLYKEAYTRQAFLPIWHPEDTGAIHGGRVPCTLGYHFIRRSNFLHVVYYIRSCDFRRHFRDDIYLTVRKVKWVIEQLQNKAEYNHIIPDQWKKVKPGIFTMHITSLHCFENDFNILNKYRNE